MLFSYTMARRRVPRVIFRPAAASTPKRAKAPVRARYTAEELRRKASIVSVQFRRVLLAEIRRVHQEGDAKGFRGNPHLYGIKVIRPYESKDFRFREFGTTHILAVPRRFVEHTAALNILYEFCLFENTKGLLTFPGSRERQDNYFIVLSIWTYHSGKYYRRHFVHAFKDTQAGGLSVTVLNSWLEGTLALDLPLYFSAQKLGPLKDASGLARYLLARDPRYKNVGGVRVSHGKGRRKTGLTSSRNEQKVLGTERTSTTEDRAEVYRRPTVSDGRIKTWVHREPDCLRYKALSTGSCF